MQNMLKSHAPKHKQKFHSKKFHEIILKNVILKIRKIYRKYFLYFFVKVEIEQRYIFQYLKTFHVKYEQNMNGNAVKLNLKN